MAKVQVKFNADDDKFSALPSADYDAIVFGAEQKDGQEFPYIAWTLKVDETEGDFAGRQLFTITSLSPKAVWRLIKMYEAIDAPFTKDEATGACDIDTDDAIGKKCVIRVIQKEYNGRMVNDIKQILPPGTKKSKSGGAGI